MYHYMKLKKKEQEHIISDFITDGTYTKSDFLKMLPDNSLTPEEIFQRNQRVSAIHQAISQLNPLYKEVIILFIFQKLSYDEISEILNIPSGTLRSRVHYGLKMLREILEREHII